MHIRMTKWSKKGKWLHEIDVRKCFHNLEQKSLYRKKHRLITKSSINVYEKSLRHEKYKIVDVKKSKHT